MLILKGSTWLCTWPYCDGVGKLVSTLAILLGICVRTTSVFVIDKQNYTVNVIGWMFQVKDVFWSQQSCELLMTKVYIKFSVICIRIEIDF